jgi:parvulin-like peptidyl-prolyl isomerase
MSRRNWILAGLAGAAVLAGSATGVSAQAPAGPAPATAAPATAPGKPPAVVNGEAISRAELDAALKQTQQSAVQLTEDQRRAQQMQALGMLVDNLLMKQFLLKNTKAPSAADVDARVAAIAAELAKDHKTIQDLLKESGESEAAFRADLGLALRWEGYSKAKVAEADVAKYYKDNKDFFDRVLVRASQIVLRVPPNATEADKAKTRQQLADLRAQLLANKIDFAEAAKKYSQSPEATNGGDVGYIPRKFVVDENFARAAFSTPVNGISDVVQTGYGLHLIKVTERKAGEPSDYAKIKDDVREFCVEEMRLGLVNDLRRSGKVEITLP